MWQKTLQKKRPCKNLQGSKIRNLVSCERDQERSPKPYKTYGERIRDAVSRRK